MKNKILFHKCILIYLLIFVFPNLAHSQTAKNSYLDQVYDLAGNRSPETQFYKMKSECITYALNGKRVGMDIYKLYLKCIPAKIANERDEYSCLKFEVQLGNSNEVSIPALSNWTYTYDAGLDEKNQVFGIDHSKFENLIDSEGKSVPFDKAYHVYNTFIDFHAFCSLFAERTSEGNGIQDLKRLNQKILHEAAFSEAPTNLGKNIAEGSLFKNGEITLEFKGLSIVNNSQCAMIGIDSGESSFKMIIHPTPEMEIVTIGSSHYKGDIYKDLTSNWVQKVTFDEIVVCETTLPMPPNKINSVVERNIIIKNVSQE